MKINKQNSSSRKKKIVIAILVVALLASAAVAAYYATRSNPGSVDTVQQLPSESDKDQAEQLSKSPEGKENTPNTDTPEPPKVDEQTGKATAQMSTSATVSGDMVYIRGGIDNAVVSDGNCYAQLSGPNGESIRKDTTLLQNPSTTDCKTIAIEASSLSKGSWVTKLYYSSNTMEGVSDEASFEVN